MSTLYIHCFDVATSQPIDTYPFEAPLAVSPECSGCVQPKAVADFFLEHGLSLVTHLTWARPSGRFSHFIAGSYRFLGRPHLYFISDTPTFPQPFRQFSADFQFALAEAAGTPYHPEPIFADGDPHHA